MSSISPHKASEPSNPRFGSELALSLPASGKEAKRYQLEEARQLLKLVGVLP